MQMQENNNPEQSTKRNSKILIGAIIFISFLFGWAFGHLDFQRQSVGFSPTNPNRKGSANFDVFWQAWDKINQGYDGQIDYQKLIYGAIDGMVKAVGDPYTAFFTPDQTQQFDSELNGSVSGIGAEVGSKDDRIIVISPIENSPAQKAGLKPQDVILQIDGTDTKGMDLNTAVSKIRGNAGSQVKLKIQRGESTFDLTITRENVQVNSVKWEVKEGDIGYIVINRFDSNTSNLVSNAADELKSKNVKGIILDLRNNPGGYLDAAVNVGSQFIKSGTIVTEKKTDNSNKEEYTASGNGKLTDIPMVVLVNGGSASAAEIVSGAIQDHNRGQLIGEKTFGKGSVQSVENLGGGATLHVTIAHWYTPNGKNINKEGLTPNIEVKLSDQDVTAGKDPQLDRAVQEIKNKIK
jgi:carboxyl-terminal processing protease